MKAKASVLVSVFVILLFSACTREQAEPAVQKPEQPASQAPTSPAETAAVNPALLDPTQADEKAPAVFNIQFETTKGDILIKVTRNWAPNGADRFYNLVKIGYFDNTAFFRVLPNFMAQFGINGNPEVNRIWRNSQIPDDPVKESNRRGYLTFATAGPDTRTTQLFINFKDNPGLDGQGFAPIGRVVQGMDVVDSLYSGYGEGSPQGKGPNQMFIQSGGDTYLKKFFPKLDYIKKATIAG
ncbi:MAG: peptidylprolyl isomerase [Acidobacteriota bacterium]